MGFDRGKKDGKITKDHMLILKNINLIEVKYQTNICLYILVWHFYWLLLFQLICDN